MRQIKMIGLDLDGTLLDEQKHLTEYTRNVLARAIEKGVVVLVATGRPVTGVPQELLDFPGMRYVLSSNGGRIMDMQEQKIIYEKPVPYEIAVEILKIFDDYDTVKEIYFDGKGYVRQDELEKIHGYLANPAMADYILNTRKGIGDHWAKMREMEGHGLDKLHGLFRNPSERLEAKARIQALGELEISDSLGMNLEVNAPGVNKGNGLLRLGELLGIEREEIMACGDGNNDLAMIKTVGFGVAMANAVQEVKDAADYITLSNEENGVAKAIERFVL